MLYANKYGLQTGDQIVEPLTGLGFSKHFAVYLGWDYHGEEWIAENHKTKGVQIITAAEYFRNVNHISRIDKFKGTGQQRRALVAKAKSLVGKPYSLVSYNCEHFASEVTSGVAESRQITIAAVSLVGLVLFNLMRKK